MQSFKITVTNEKGKERQHAWQLPEKWEELQPLDWSHLIPAKLDDNIYRSQVQLLYQLSRGKKKLNADILLLLSADQLSQLVAMTDWMFSTPITVSPFQSIRIQRKSYLLPNDQLKYMSLIEFAFLDFHYMRYTQYVSEGKLEEAEAELDSMLCYMLRPIAKGVDPYDAANYKGDRREMLNTSVCEQRKELFKELPAWQRYACLFFFSGCKEQLHERYKGTIWIDGLDEDGNQVIGAKPQRPEEWMRLAYGMAGGKFGTLEQTMYTPLETILLEIVFQKAA
ncbi:MAG: hypothetical protein AAFQ92_26830 [Bacteroidota bacterium]